jgi:hypothetical protein
VKSSYTKALSTRNMRDPRHLMRLVKFRALTGTDTERIAAIAKSEGVSKETIKASVRQMEMYAEQNKAGNVDLRINESILRVMPAFENSMAGLLAATELVEVPDGNTGNKRVVEQDDKTTRLEASRIVKDIIVSKQPKGPIAEINVNQNTQIANLSSAETTEERMDRLRKKAAEANLLPAEIVAVPGYLDRDEEPDDDDSDDDEEE